MCRFCAGGSWNISGRGDQAQVSKSRLHRLVATQDLLHLPDRVHPRRAGSCHLFLLLQRGPRCLAAGQGGLEKIAKGQQGH